LFRRLRARRRRREPDDCVESHLRLLGTIARLVVHKTPPARATNPIHVDDAFLALAFRHRLYPITSFALSQDATILVSQSARKSLEQRHICVGARNLGAVAQLTQLLRLFESHAIEVISFKGPVIAQSVYGSVARREFDDLDLIVRGNDFARSGALLESFGYRSRASSRVGRFGPRIHHGVFHPAVASHVPIELHCDAPRWHFPLRTRVDDLFARCTSLPLGGHAIRVPGPEDQFLMMCAHAASHAWTSLEHVLCLAVALGSQSLDWSFLVEESRRVGASRMLSLGLAMAQGVCAATVDADVERLVGSDSYVARFSDTLIRRCFEPMRPRAPQRTLTHFRSLDRVTDRLRYTARRMVTSATFG